MDLARHIEQTLLRPEATAADVEAHCRRAAEYQLFGVCIASRFVPLARRSVEGTGVRVVTVVAFPHGAVPSSVKAAEARNAVEDGADELDMVISVGDARAGDFAAVERDVRAVRDATAGRVLKVILETGFLSDEQIDGAARAAVSAGADFVKTSTGYGPRGATVADIERLVRAVEGRAGVKASGGIRTRDAALEMLNAGASRIGTSSGVEMVAR
ncbi:MAG TPA: deoxyribose-phosphate aldolase [Polyangiaceae bacterium]|jgi:deoxyribose-phosphate aldolase|nr:deoxyribose-phosphate aldolase [Polyangiaceae bacterium]